MKTIIAICVYDRFQNIKEWVRCWSSCEQSADVYIIHNYKNEQERDAYKVFCDEVGFAYVPRVNVGMDIGAFQDVCRGRLEGFPNEWEYLFWITDDVLPMDRNFVKLFKDHLGNKENAVSAMEISPEVRRHIRTTGFMLSQETASKIQFLVDPITTKADCYAFEHRSDFTFLDQILKMGKRAVQVAPIQSSPLWDSGQTRRQAREKEHYRVFPIERSEDKEVVCICTVYERKHPPILSVMLNQTHKNWKLLLLHDGKNSTGIKELVDFIGDDRIKFIETSERKGRFGHHLRQYGIAMLSKLYPNAEYFFITNDDNHHTPTYIEYMLQGFDDNTKAVYCSDMVHSYLNHKVIRCKMNQGFVDCAGVMLRAEVAEQVGWRDIESHSADWYFFRDVINKYGIESFNKVDGCLLVHN